MRSQDKENLVKVNRLDVSVLVENGELTKKGLIRNLYDNDEDFLGIYSTKERALEVLDEIQKFIESLFESAIEIPAPIFNMPEE